MAELGNNLGSLATGCSISAGWLPCIGPSLGTSFTLGLTSSSVGENALLVLAYSLGLALPFIAIRAVFVQTPAALRWPNHHSVTTTVAGVFVIVTGTLLFRGALQELNSCFNNLSGSGLEPISKGNSSPWWYIVTKRNIAPAATAAHCGPEL